MGVSVEKTWLMDYGVLRLVNQCRRLILAEFGFKPALANKQLRHQLAHYVGKSRQRRLQECYAELRLALDALEGPDPLPESSPEETPTGDTAGERASAVTAKTVIYRGRVVRSG